jgi:hypothetical protein
MAGLVSSWPAAVAAQLRALDSTAAAAIPSNAANGYRRPCRLRGSGSAANRSNSPSGLLTSCSTTYRVRLVVDNGVPLAGCAATSSPPSNWRKPPWIARTPIQERAQNPDFGAGHRQGH